MICIWHLQRLSKKRVQAQGIQVCELLYLSEEEFEFLKLKRELKIGLAVPYNIYILFSCEF
jgi:hypothetical protein